MIASIISLLNAENVETPEEKRVFNTATIFILSLLIRPPKRFLPLVHRHRQPLSLHYQISTNFPALVLFPNWFINSLFPFFHQTRNLFLPRASSRLNALICKAPSDCNKTTVLSDKWFTFKPNVDRMID